MGHALLAALHSACNLSASGNLFCENSNHHTPTCIMRRRREEQEEDETSDFFAQAEKLDAEDLYVPIKHRRREGREGSTSAAAPPPALAALPHSDDFLLSEPAADLCSDGNARPEEDAIVAATAHDQECRVTGGVRLRLQQRISKIAQRETAKRGYP